MYNNSFSKEIALVHIIQRMAFILLLIALNNQLDLGIIKLHLISFGSAYRFFLIKIEKTWHPCHISDQ